MPAVRKNVRPTVIAVDEAARLMEPELWPALTWYTPRAVLLIGDHRQLRPLVFTRPAEHPFSPQPGLSLFLASSTMGTWMSLSLNSIVWSPNSAPW
ncbi:hypothetical protein BDW62DRAFT_194116 [Aspergillus aurantiobrunneus]